MILATLAGREMGLATQMRNAQAKVSTSVTFIKLFLSTFLFQEEQVLEAVPRATESVALVNEEILALSTTRSLKAFCHFQ